jgi:hypothetical protein
MFRNNGLNLSGSAITLPPQPPIRSSFQDDVSSTNAILRVDSTDASTVHTNKSGGSAYEDTPNDDDRSVDSDIGREYDARNLQHDTIRQEALRMLEVADADTNYSVHRTITGGFTAQAKSISGHPRRTKSALQALNFTAQRTKIGQRFSDYATSPSTKAYKDNDDDRDSYEYGETTSTNGGVVDMIGIGERSAASSAKHPTGTGNWSSRYSIDSTMLAMSGGSMQPRPWSTSTTTTNTNTNTERFAARNLFRNSPASSPQIFGSGFQFRQQHVFGKQRDAERNIHADGLFNESSTSPMNNPRLKTWQDQLMEKKRKQRRCILAILLILMCTLIPMITLITAHSKKQSMNGAKNDLSFGKQNEPVDNASIDTTMTHEEVIFYVTANVPYTADEEVQLQNNFATVSQSGAHFLIHLGNIHNSDTSACDSTTYNRVADMMEDASTIPMFIIPGEEDWNDCDDPDSAWDAWFATYELYNQRWGYPSIVDGEALTVFRQRDQLENWAFLVKGVLMIGVHVVNGIKPDEVEFRERNHMNLQWIKGMSKQHESVIRAVVVCGNAQPGHSTNAGLFSNLDSFWREYSKPTLYIHTAPSAGSNAYSNKIAAEFYQPFKDLSNLWATQVEKTSDNLPVRITIGLNNDNPFTVA